jgi:hypothetical protein
LLHPSSSLCPCCLVVYCRGRWMPTQPWNAPALHYCQTPSSSVTTANFPVVRPHHQTPPAATAIKPHLRCCLPLPPCLHCHCHRLPSHPSLLSNITTPHCHPLLQPSNAIFAAAAFCVVQAERRSPLYHLWLHLRVRLSQGATIHHPVVKIERRRDEGGGEVSISMKKSINIIAIQNSSLFCWPAAAPPPTIPSRGMLAIL